VFKLAVIYWPAETGLEEGWDRSYPEGINCGRTSRWGSRIVCNGNKTEDYGLHMRL